MLTSFFFNVDIPRLSPRRAIVRLFLDLRRWRKPSSSVDRLIGSNFVHFMHLWLVAMTEIEKEIDTNAPFRFLSMFRTTIDGALVTVTLATA